MGQLRFMPAQSLGKSELIHEEGQTQKGVKIQHLSNLATLRPDLPSSLPLRSAHSLPSSTPSNFLCWNCFNCYLALLYEQNVWTVNCTGDHYQNPNLQWDNSAAQYPSISCSSLFKTLNFSSLWHKKWHLLKSGFQAIKDCYSGILLLNFSFTVIKPDNLIMHISLQSLLPPKDEINEFQHIDEIIDISFAEW